jgi:hypothetical protein
MNYFEYTVEVELTEEIEKKSKELIDAIKTGKCILNIHKISDETFEEGEKKKIVRTFTLTSLTNINQVILHFFKGYCATYHCYYKTPVMM